MPYAPINKFWYATELIDATYLTAGCPNNDTAYSVAMVYLSKEPGNTHDTGNTTRTLLDDGAHRVHVEQLCLCRPACWIQGRPLCSYRSQLPGKLPAGVTSVKPNCPTPWMLILGRTVVNGVEDLPAVHAIQSEYKLTPLSYWGKLKTKYLIVRDVYKPEVSLLESKDPLGPWKTLNARLIENPPPAHHAILFRQFADIGIGPGQDVEMQPEAVKKALQRALGSGMLLLRQHFMSGAWATVVNG